MKESGGHGMDSIISPLSPNSANDIVGLCLAIRDALPTGWPGSGPLEVAPKEMSCSCQDLGYTARLSRCVPPEINHLAVAGLGAWPWPR